MTNGGERGLNAAYRDMGVFDASPGAGGGGLLLLLVLLLSLEVGLLRLFLLRMLVLRLFLLRGRCGRPG